MLLLPRVTENVAFCGCQGLFQMCSVIYHVTFQIMFFRTNCPYLVPFHCTCLINCKLLIYSMVVFDSITCQTVVSDPSFWCSDTGNVALEEECEEIVGAQLVGREWQPNEVM